MESSNEKRRRLLGQPCGTASHHLRRLLLFKFVKQLGLDTCYRCSTPITTLRELSIEHTVPWEGAANPKEAFFDLDAIAFSHLGCNSRAAKKYPGPRVGHGTNKMYDKYKCRCEPCKTAHSAKGFT